MSIVKVNVKRLIVRFFGLLVVILTSTAIAANHEANKNSALHNNEPLEIDARVFGTFSTAKTVPSSSGKIIVVSSDMIVNDCTVPADRHIKIVKGGSLIIPDGKTLFINSRFETGPYKVFSPIGTGKVLIGANSVEKVFPEWFGVYIDGSHKKETTTAIQQAINATPPDAELILNSGIYLVKNLNITKPLTIRCIGRINLVNGITIANIKGTVRLLNPIISQVAKAPKCKVAIDAEASTALEIFGGKMTDIRRAIRTQNISRVLISGVTIKLVGDTTTTGTAVQIRNAAAVEVADCDLSLPDTSSSITNSHSGISINYGRNVRIVNNIIKQGYSAIVVRESDTKPGDLSSDVIISGNTLVGQRVAHAKPAQGIYIQRTSRLRIERNIVEDFGYTGIAVVYPTNKNVTIINNKVHTMDKRSKFGILTSYICDGAVTGNVISGTPAFGIQINDGKDVNVEGNRIEIASRPSSRAILLAGLNGGVIDNNYGAASISFRITGTINKVRIGRNRITAATAIMDDSTGRENLISQ